MVKKSSTRRRIRLRARRETSIIFSARGPARSAGSILFRRSQDQRAVASGFLISCATKPRYFPRALGDMRRTYAQAQECASERLLKSYRSGERAGMQILPAAATYIRPGDVKSL